MFTSLHIRFAECIVVLKLMSENAVACSDRLTVHGWDLGQDWRMAGMRSFIGPRPEAERVPVAV